MNLVRAAPKLFDCRSLAPAAHERAVLSLFDSLEVGGSIVIVSEENPLALLAALQSARKGLFEWSPLEVKDGRWQVEVTRRPGAPGALRELTEALAWDHDRLEAIEASAFAARAAGDLTAARERFERFAYGLRRHIRFEEELLFPEFETRSGVGPDAGPTAVMRREHRQIEELLDRIRESIGEPGRGADALRWQLLDVLGEHNVKEERVLYPGTDRLLSEAERDDLVARIQAT